MQIKCEINKQVVEATLEASGNLLRFLRQRGLWSVKYGCDTGECGACSVLVNGELVLSCLYPAAKAEGQQITTVEALGNPKCLHPLQQLFLDRGAVQCGYCTPAMLLAVQSLLERTPQPTEDEARAALAGVLCRCTGYLKPLECALEGTSAASATHIPRGTRPKETYDPKARDAK